MNLGRTVFSQITEHLPAYEFQKCVERYRGDSHFRGFSCLDQYLAMAFAQLTYRESLRDEPDFKIETPTGSLGMEVTEILRSNSGPFPPVAEENLHKEVVRLAEEHYQRSCKSPVDVLVYFLNDWPSKRDKKDMARALSEYVQSHYEPGTTTAIFSRLNGLPEGFSLVRVSSLGGQWISQESGVLPLLQHEQLVRRINEKNALLPKYRSRLPNCPIWLLIYTAVTVSRGVPIPTSISEWTCQSDFDKVLFFSALDNRVFEIDRTPLAGFLQKGAPNPIYKGKWT